MISPIVSIARLPDFRTDPSAWGVNNVPSPVVVVDFAALFTGLALVLTVESMFVIAVLPEEGMVVVTDPVVLEDSVMAAWTLVLEPSNVLSVDVMASGVASAEDEPKGTGLGRVIVGVLVTTTIGDPVIVVAEL